MANTRIKDLSNTATNVASDAFIAIDGSSNGTEKISRDNLRQDTADALAASPSTYNLAPLTSGSVDVDKGGTGSTTVAGAKTNLEVPNVGTAANEVPVNGMLGDLAFQSSEGPSVGALEAESTIIKSDSGVTTTQALSVTNGAATRLAVLEDGRVGVGTASVTTGFNLEVVSGDMRVADAAGADACELGYSAGAGKSFVQSYNRNTSVFSDLVLNNVATVTANGRLIIANIPTSASGLASGTVWSDSGTLKIVS